MGIVGSRAVAGRFREPDFSEAKVVSQLKLSHSANTANAESLVGVADDSGELPFTVEGGIHLLGPHATCWGRTSNSLPRADGTAPDRLVRRSEAGGRTAVRALVNADD